MNIFRRMDFHMLALTVVDYMLTIYFVSTGKTVPLFTTSCTEQLRGQKVDNEQANF